MSLYSKKEPQCAKEKFLQLSSIPKLWNSDKPPSDLPKSLQQYRKLWLLLLRFNCKSANFFYSTHSFVQNIVFYYKAFHMKQHTDIGMNCLAICEVTLEKEKLTHSSKTSELPKKILLKRKMQDGLASVLLSSFP